MTNRRRTSSQSPHDRSDELEQSATAYPAASEASPAPRPPTRQAVHEADRIGDILRRVREHRRERLEDISEYLRIRPTYLFALENSRYEDLPADAYVIGFLRTYAAYLGLDGKGAIDQYRREMAGRRRKPQLSMPQPMSEGRAPTVLVMVSAAIAALLLYGVWYGLSSPDKESLAKAPELEQTTQDTPPATPSDPNVLTSQTSTSDGISLPVPASSTVMPAPLLQEAVKPSLSTATEHPALSATPSNVSSPPPAAPTQPQTTLPETKTKENKDTKAEEPKAEVKTPVNDLKDKKPAPVAEEKPKAEKSPDKPQSRMTIKADKESWVLVTDSKGNTVFDKTMKAGETYSVPSVKGLRLTTGNPKGVTLSVDGKPMPKLKADDPVVRAVPLDPETITGKVEGTAPATNDTQTDEQDNE